uniref:Uncharacterized protein n=1 Tax=Romanomermis culicivorax TaxID=13658 RepID=A0A915IBX7_ROMCU
MENLLNPITLHGKLSRMFKRLKMQKFLGASHQSLISAAPWPSILIELESIDLETWVKSTVLKPGAVTKCIPRTISALSLKTVTFLIFNFEIGTSILLVVEGTVKIGAGIILLVGEVILTGSSKLKFEYSDIVQSNSKLVKAKTRGSRITWNRFVDSII